MKECLCKTCFRKQNCDFKCEQQTDCGCYYDEKEWKIIQEYYNKRYEKELRVLDDRYDELGV